MKYSKHRTKKFLSGKGYYLALAACLVAVCVAAFSAAETISSVEDDLSSISSIESVPENPSSKLQSAEQTGQNVSDVEDNRSSATEFPEDESKIDISSISYAMPIKGASIGKNYSSDKLQYSKTYGDMRLHLGIDLQGAEGADVLSATAGTVEKVYDDSLWGKTVVIDHGYGITARYCGLKNITVSVGESIAAGVKIGEVSVVPCESEDPSHIHIALIRDGSYFSPVELLSMIKK